MSIVARPASPDHPAAAVQQLQRSERLERRITIAGIFVLLALGLNIVVGLSGLLDLGYAAFFAVGAYTYAFAASSFTPTSTCRSGRC